MTYLFITFSTLLLQYYIICISKSVLSYNEELFIYSIYVMLFFVILNLMPYMVKNVIIKEVFNLIEFYEKLFFFKMLLLSKIILLINILIKKEINKNLLFINYCFFSKRKLILKNFYKKKFLEYLEELQFFTKKII